MLYSIQQNLIEKNRLKRRAFDITLWCHMKRLFFLLYSLDFVFKKSFEENKKFKIRREKQWKQFVFREQAVETRGVFTNSKNTGPMEAGKQFIGHTKSPF